MQRGRLVVNNKRERAAYIAAVERLAVAECPALSGRINWDTVTHCWFAGKGTTEAARAVINEGPITRR